MLYLVNHSFSEYIMGLIDRVHHHVDDEVAFAEMVVEGNGHPALEAGAAYSLVQILQDFCRPAGGEEFARTVHEGIARPGAREGFELPEAGQ